jgi:hypothetical protein
LTITKIQSYQSGVKQLRVAAYCQLLIDNIEQLESLKTSESITKNTLATMLISG